MIGWRGGVRFMECDTCDGEVEAESGEEFEDFVARARRAGWKAAKVGKDWVHACPRHKT